MKFSIQILLCALCLSACATDNPPVPEVNNAPASDAAPTSNQREATKEEVELILKGKIRSKSGSEQALSKEDVKKILKGEYKNPDNENIKFNNEDLKRIIKSKAPQH